MPHGIEPFYAELGRRLHDLRHRAGLTQEELGARLSPRVTRTSIANIETGKQRVLVKTLVDLAEALGAEVTDLLPQVATRPAPPTRRESGRIREELTTKLDLPREQLDHVFSKIQAASKEAV